MDCIACHNTAGWEIPRDSLKFDHGITRFDLEGQHAVVDCKSCHAELKFTGASSECISCHQDMHEQTLGTDCARCHTPNTWLVDNITDIHQQIGFPLVGAHVEPNCYECHTAASQLRFDPIGVECINCHREDYEATTAPNHQSAGYSTDCTECHSIFAFDWGADGFTHDFFPLTGGHDIQDCARCHMSSDYSDISSDCFACHQTDYETTTNPNHQAAGIPTDCAQCHTTDPGWSPADFAQHDGDYFPIYTGEHAGEWASCNECHTNPNDLSVFSCTVCHEHNQTDMDDEHAGVSGYTYESSACLACHPTGMADGSFDHNSTDFPLTGAHVSVDCIQCHAQGYEGTTTVCNDCHNQDYQASLNPNHNSLGISTDCASCHTTNPDWNPATFDVHDEYYVLNGAHAAIANDCAACHNGDYNNTPNTCFGCHADDYNNTTDPSHVDLQFSTDCMECHGESAWAPSTFDHDGQFFPIYSGTHIGAWTNCAECHTTPGDYTLFSCTECHEHNQPDTDEAHDGVSGYSYNSTSCFACHPTGTADDVFDHNMTAFPLTGAHQDVDCISCHAAGYEGTPTDCFACHEMDFTETANPGHVALDLPMDCALCHTTDPDWSPASFPIHDQFYALEGAHSVIANDCASCHQGDYQNTPNTCFGCHQQDYEQTSDPDHAALAFSTDCAECHGQNAWVPSTFDHDGQFFPIYTGSHAGEWGACLDCHTTPGDYAMFTCVTCHMNPETNEEHEGVGGYIYESTACLACHPTGESDIIFDHNTTGFPLTGAHTTTDCLQCHATGYEGTPSECSACHTPDYNAASNPNHVALGLPTDCASCHTTNPGWDPATFDIHNEFYALNGAHAAIANDCAACHNGDYLNTPTDCYACHTDDYNQTTDPNHMMAQFSTDCATCHSENAWQPSTFDHDGQYFPIYSGEHLGTWDACVDCHTNPDNYAEVSCIACHTNPETNEEHEGVPGYAYDNSACLACHPTGDADVVFDHNTTGFPLTQGHAGVDCISCHSAGYEGTSSECVACHQMDYDQSTNPSHSALGLSTDCASCHTTNPDWNPAAFDVHNEYYALNGAHAAIANDCATCHNGDYTNTPNTCFGCHQQDYEQTTNPPHASAQFSTDCMTCHNESAWLPATFDHDGMYFPIYSGSHNGVWDECSQCHMNANDYADFTCFTCHASGETEQEHIGVNGYTYNSIACLVCHPTGEGDEGFDHNNTDFPLTGAHIGVDCIECHAAGYEGTPTECSACHLGDYNGSTNPDHASLALSTDCASCHTTNPGWSPATFDVHNDYYVLDGAHAAVAGECALCHAGGNYANTPTECFACHEQDYNASVNPDHQSLDFPTDCASCHTTNPEWNPATFDIHNDYYPLNGAHAMIANECALCHLNGDYTNTPTTCFGCHQEDYNATTNPDHEAAQFPTDCAQCHSESTWQPATFDHDLIYPLNGAHAAIENNCVLCHLNPDDYSDIPNTCVGCHQADYNATTNPDHQGAQFPTDCAQCHSEDAWSPANFDHDQFYPLNGAHATIENDCALCHTNPDDYSDIPNTCFGCHQGDYNATTNPDHQGAQFPTDCAQCHTEDAWVPATFDHDQFYPLNGAHATIENDCALCHTNPDDYSDIPNTCFGCHQDDYNATTNPDHQGAQFPTDCAQCHTEDAWIPATFDHDEFYPLNGAHATIENDCALCHTNPDDYSDIPNTCFGCHQDDYNATNDPDHQAAQFPTDCASCHSENAWVPSTFDHDGMYFPIYSGKHEDEWNSCSECHANPNDYSEFTCLTCHLPGETNEDHDEVPEYQYESNACYACHPTGED